VPWLPEREIIDQLLEDLKVDRCLTTEQCFRRYGLSDHSIKVLRQRGFVRTTRMRLRPTQWSKADIPVTIVSVARSRYDPLQTRGMSHLLGMAEVRWLLRDRITHWGTEIQGQEKTYRVDVVAHDADGELLVEYDTGLYAAQVVQKKAELARRLGRRQFWATPSEAKAAKLCEWVPDGEIWLVRWDDGSARLVRSSPGAAG